MEFGIVARVGRVLCRRLGDALLAFGFGCFIFVAFMVVDENTTQDVRASAQNLFNLVIIGIGVIVGSKIAGWIAEWAKGGTETIDYRKLFSVPMWASLACLLLLMAFYPGRAALRARLAPSAE